ncbi:hypothetical protein W03_23600 [Nitrosomonas sp. PY1]|uniref:hypothetical protein n=1 Tax=Nitrosomonas sp. PY1 TaxID=1803906 RepID=UPI001FC7CBF4|nr:hypothetical protein [Nitrosomonas sp. PY1]GKS68671.1 hypothetical protein W03_06750 [Nitrosomonas sp. PY1]GKS70356.1 hypothetical protein W03_23600 [Nitrosomonas sp. PY1]
MTRQKIWTGISVFIFAMVFYTSTVQAHGKVAIEEDSCMRRIGENMIHLSTYQPQIDEEGHYCTDIPKIGNSILVIDLVDPSLRDMPIGIKIVKGSSVNEGETVKHIQPALYEDGVISTQSSFDQGKYLVLITAEGVPPLNYEYHLRVEMVNYANVFRASIGPIVALLLTTLLGYKLFKSKRFRSWLANRGSKKN